MSSLGFRESNTRIIVFFTAVIPTLQYGSNLCIFGAQKACSWHVDVNILWRQRSERDDIDIIYQLDEKTILDAER